MPPRHVRSYSDFYRHGRSSTPIAIKKKVKAKKVTHSSDTSAVLFFSKKRSKNAIGFNWSLIKRWVIIFMIASWIALPLYAPYFRVKDVVFENFPSHLEMNARMTARSAIEPSWFLGIKNNYFVLNTEEIQKTVSDNFPTVENVVVTKKFPAQLVISATEKNPVAIYDNGKNYYYIDSEGNILRKITEVENSEFEFPKHNNSEPASSTTTVSSTTILNDTIEEKNENAEKNSYSERIHTPNFKKISTAYGLYPIIYDNRKDNIFKEKGVIPSSTLRSIISWNHWIQDEKIAKVKYFLIENSIYSGVKIFTDKPWYVHFEPLNDNAMQFKNLKITLQNFKPKKYIIVRFSKPNELQSIDWQ